LASDAKSFLNDDHFSLNIKTAKGNFFFAINGNGAVYDAENGDVSWNGHWKYGNSGDGSLNYRVCKKFC